MNFNSPSRLPAYLASGEVFRRGEQIAVCLPHLSKSIDAKISDLFLRPVDSIWDCILLCELIADSRGYPCWHGPWNIYLCEWLYKAKYVAKQETVDTAFFAIKRMLERPESNAEASMNQRNNLPDLLEGLIRRLTLPQRQMARLNPIVSATDFRKSFVRERAHSKGLIDGGLFATDPDIEFALQAAAVRLTAVSGIDFTFSTEPTLESVEAIRVMLHRFRTKVNSVRCDAWIGSNPNLVTVTSMSWEFWGLLLAQIESLARLEHFESFKLGIDEATAIAILEIPSLGVFRIKESVVEPEISRRINIGDSFVSALVQRGPINVVDVPHLEVKDQIRVLTAKPDLILQVNGRAVELPETVRDRDVLQKQREACDNAPQVQQITDSGLTDPFYPFEVSCSKEDGSEIATVGFGVFSKYNWALELESLDDYYLNGYGIAGLLQAIIHDNQLSENVDSIDAEGSDVLVTLNGWKAAKRLGKVAAKALRDEKKLRQLIARTRELGFED